MVFQYYGWIINYPKTQQHKAIFYYPHEFSWRFWLEHPHVASPCGLNSKTWFTTQWLSSKVLEERKGKRMRGRRREEKERQTERQRDSEKRRRGGQRKPRRNLYVFHDLVLEVTHLCFQDILFTCSQSLNLVHIQGERTQILPLNGEVPTSHYKQSMCNEIYFVFLWPSLKNTICQQ